MEKTAGKAALKMIKTFLQMKIKGESYLSVLISVLIISIFSAVISFFTKSLNYKVLNQVAETEKIIEKKNNIQVK